MARGTVKYFNDQKGYGFITPDEGTRDYFVHHSDITMEGYRTLEQGQRVHFDPREGDRGPLAGNVTLI